MDTNRSILINRYAQAFFTVDSSILNDEVIKNMHTLVKHNAKKPLALYLVSFSALSGPERFDMIKQYLRHFNLKEEFDRLAKLLIQQRRVVLLPDILLAIAALYKKAGGQEEFSITSVQELSKEECDNIITFLERQLNASVCIKTSLDQNLIAGIRMQSPLWLWEHSIRQKIRTIRSSDVC